MPTVFERLCNWVNDRDLTWVGFGKLRPKPQEDMSGRVVVILCFVYCPLIAALAYAITCFVLMNAARSAPRYLPWTFAAAAAVAFVLMQSLLARAWNRRAARLRNNPTP